MITRQYFYQVHIILMITVVCTACSEITLRADLVAVYRAEDNYNDSSGNGYDATVNGTVGFREGAPGFGQGFDVDNIVNTAAINYLSIPSLSGANAFNLSGPGLTVAAWFREDNFANNGSLINLRGGGNGSGFTVEPAFGSPGSFLIVVFTDTGFQQIQVPGFTVGGTFHIAAVFDPANLLLSIYRNGKLVSSVATNSTQLMTINGNESLLIGRNTVTSTGFDGMIDEVRLYSQALSPTEIAELVAPVIPGDVNGDGVVNLLDVAPFVEALSSGTFNPAADINGDGVVNLLDVQPFVELLTG